MVQRTGPAFDADLISGVIVAFITFVSLQICTMRSTRALRAIPHVLSK